VSLDFKPVRANLGQQVFNYLLENIYKMDILPGSRLGVGEIADQLGISRSPVRDALHMLVAEGLVQYGKTNGYEVIPITRQYIEDVFVVRRALEPTALRLAAAHLDKEHIQRLCVTWESLRANHHPMTAETLDLYVTADNDLHQSLGDLSGNQVLNELVTKIVHKAAWIRRWVYFNDIPAAHLTTIAEEHLEILEALLNQEIERAVELLERHLILGQAKALEFVDQ
jgi:DNA-binding GntR family transcriptional regulator